MLFGWGQLLLDQSRHPHQIPGRRWPILHRNVFFLWHLEAQESLSSVMSHRLEAQVNPSRIRPRQAGGSTEPAQSPAASTPPPAPATKMVGPTAPALMDLHTARTCSAQVGGLHTIKTCSTRAAWGRRPSGPVGHQDLHVHVLPGHVL